MEEYQITAVVLEHTATGARHIHFDCEDTNNVFSVAFPTIPRDSTGVAHILEHTALCGSERYPIRDPFFNMTHRRHFALLRCRTTAHQRVCCGVRIWPTKVGLTLWRRIASTPS